MMIAWAVAIAWACLIAGAVALRGKRMAALWREPMFRVPVLTLESDDWGPGPASHATSLQRLAQTLSRNTDRRGRHPVVTLGVVLGESKPVPSPADPQDASAIETLASDRYREIRDAMFQGVAAGVFSLHLHGMTHYWPPAVLRAAKDNAAVRDWLLSSSPRCSEQLPAHLQSRWIDAGTLPPNPIPETEVRRAARDEARLFQDIFGRVPRVAVPPTFVWNPAVESGWREQGITTVVTPGYRREARDSQGNLCPPTRQILNGERSEEGLVYVVRDAYFEPAKGHTAERGLKALDERTWLGRPTLLEMHRFNFTGGDEESGRAFDELARLLDVSLARYPDLTFLSTEELAGAFSAFGSEWLEQAVTARVLCWIRRLNSDSGIRKLGWITGVALGAAAVRVALESTARRRARERAGDRVAELSKSGSRPSPQPPGVPSP